MTAKDDAGKAMGPVEKQQWLDDAAALAHLSRAELAALIVIANTMNSKTGIAWLSMATIGRRTGTTIRTANRTIRRLLELGLIELVKRGTWQGKANHYTLNRHYFSQPVGSDAGDTTPSKVVTPSVEGSDAQGTKVVTPTSDISIPESEPLAKDEGDRSQAEAGTAPLRPVGACVASRQTKRARVRQPPMA
ncbi:helix-turn-helix domain-containing protein [Geopseudomonas guangdongensis]|uniref:Helix-turn-helix domain-containing protein n=1 Tax=Geopseudomonas guangdongensis TaxID=1245526 RepID=A0A1H2I619_9GAMM|nr:helix-turn-helix domain-containing protein [Pseudomonas guangdongensis]SDU39258.1 Helix-turn-helix domain-containing protein [Pseudomonas guangdongensis]